MLTVLLFLPAVGAALVATLPRARQRDARWVALAVALATFALTAIVTYMTIGWFPETGL